jgi:hypothetical protein
MIHENHRQGVPSMPIDSPAPQALKKMEPILDRLDLDACLRNLKGTWAVKAIDEGSGSERTQALYTYARPEYAVAQAMADGAAPEDALREWQAAINKMLAEFRPKRRHSLLVEATSALRQAGAPVPGQPTRTPAASAKALETTGDISPMHLALATLAVYQTSDIRDLLGELAASTAPLPGWDKPPQLDLQLIQQSLRTTRQAHEALEAELTTTQAQLKDHQEENELLLLQLHQVQEELERYYLRNLELEQKTKSKQPGEEEQSIRSLERRIHLIEHSTSWRLTTPLRLLTRILFRKGDPKPPPDVSAPEEKRIRYLQRRIEQLETSTSWKATAPLRTVGLMFKAESRNSAKKKG